MDDKEQKKPETPLTGIELMEHYQISRSTLWNWLGKGMPHIKVGRVRRYYLADVQAWLKHIGSKGITL